jgi:hypothetical protein
LVFFAFFLGPESPRFTAGSDSYLFSHGKMVEVVGSHAAAKAPKLGLVAGLSSRQGQGYAMAALLSQAAAASAGMRLPNRVDVVAIPTAVLDASD